MSWPLIAFTAFILIAWLGALAWLARGFRRGWLLEDDTPPPQLPPRRDLKL